jgi:hypothetical protein
MCYKKALRAWYNQICQTMFRVCGTIPMPWRAKMTDIQFEQLINGISLIAAESHIANVLSNMAACNAEAKRDYADVFSVYLTAEQFRKKIQDWDSQEAFDYEQFLEKTFGKVPPGH